MPPSKLQHVNSGGRNFVIDTCFFLASKIPGRNPTKPRMDAQRSLLHACQGWTAGSRPSPYVLAGVACLRSTVIPWHMQQRLHKVWGHWLTSHEPIVTQYAAIIHRGFSPALAINGQMLLAALQPGVGFLRTCTSPENWIYRCPMDQQYYFRHWKALRWPASEGRVGPAFGKEHQPARPRVLIPVQTSLSWLRMLPADLCRWTAELLSHARCSVSSLSQLRPLHCHQKAARVLMSKVIGF